MENHKGKIPNFGMYTLYNSEKAFSMDDFRVSMVAYHVADESLENIEGEFYLLDPFFRRMSINLSILNSHNTASHIGPTKTPMGGLWGMFRDLKKNPKKYKPKE